MIVEPEPENGSNTMPPERHLGYAVQWFGLALTVLVVAATLTFRMKKKAR